MKSYISLTHSTEENTMFGSIGFPELLVILTIALLIFGPKKLPEVGRSIGKALREFRKTSDEIRGKIEEEIQAEEFREMKKDIDDLTDIYDQTDTPKDIVPKSEGKKAASPAKKTKTGKKTAKSETAKTSH